MRLDGFMQLMDFNRTEPVVVAVSKSSVCIEVPDLSGHSDDRFHSSGEHWVVLWPNNHPVYILVDLTGPYTLSSYAGCSHAAYGVLVNWGNLCPVSYSIDQPSPHYLAVNFPAQHIATLLGSSLEGAVSFGSDLELPSSGALALLVATFAGEVFPLAVGALLAGFEV